jgi:cobalt-zinc-cadmium efflux system protein
VQFKMDSAYSLYEVTQPGADASFSRDRVDEQCFQQEASCKFMDEHSHGPQDFNRVFAIGVTLNLLYVGAQLGFGFASHSLALIADAGHNLGDVLGLVMAWGANYLAKRPPTAHRTYGWRRTSIMAALFNAVFLLLAVGAISWEALRRLNRGDVVDPGVVIWVAAGGVVINGITAWLFMAGGKSDLNIRSAFLHMAADAGISAGVVVAGIAISLTGWMWLDPATSIAINVIIVIGTWSLLRESFNLATDAVPEKVNLVAVREYLSQLPDVSAVHDLHIWAMSTTEIALTAHLVIPNGLAGDSFLHAVCDHLHHEFGIEHSTIQIEQNADSCALA